MILLYNDDCFNILPQIIQNTIDLIIVDLPYGQTHNEWDLCIDLKQMWIELKRICKDKCVILFFCTTKFGLSLINSNPNAFRYDIVWEKSIKQGFLNANNQPLRAHEMIYVFNKNSNNTIYPDNILLKAYFLKIFKYINKNPKDIRLLLGQKKCNHCWYQSTQFTPPVKRDYDLLINEYKINNMEGFLTYEELCPEKVKEENKKKTIRTYNPQFSEGKAFKASKTKKTASNYGEVKNMFHNENDGFRYPCSVLKFNSQLKTIHPTQKPTELIEYLIKTYSNERDVVLDFTMGSGSVGEACKRLNRNFIGIEKDKDIFFKSVNWLW